MFESWVEEYFHFIGYHSCPPVIYRNCLGVMEIFNAQKQSAYTKSAHTKCRDIIRSNHMQFRYLRYRYASFNILPHIKPSNFRFTFWFTKRDASGGDEKVDSHWWRLLSNHVLDIKRRNSFHKIPNGTIKLSNGSDRSKRSNSKSFKSQFSWHDR